MNHIKSYVKPSSIAVVGASRSKEKVGHQILKNILDSGYKGSVYPINPSAKTILKKTVYPTISDLPHAPELAIFVTPAPLIPYLIKEASDKGTKAAIIITAGFAETGSKGRQLQKKLQKVIDENPIKVLGPNCLGTLSTHNKLNATFGPPLPKKGNIMLISQSGALVTGILDWLQQNDLGLSHALTLGNRIDVSENDALDFAKKDKNTNIVMIYLESFKDAPEFFKKASEITPKKPVILLKGGQSQAGQSASASHTAALASDYTLIEAFAKQTGVILARNTHQWLNASAVFSRTSSLKGLDIGIITNAGGPGVLTTDDAEEHDLNIAPLSKKTKDHLSKALTHVAPHNPLDILGDALPEHFATSLSIVGKDRIQDALVVIMTPQTTTQPRSSARAIVERSKKISKPIFVVLLGGSKLEPAREIFEKANIPTFTYPNHAIDVIAAKAHYDAHKNHIFPFPGRKSSIVSTSTKDSLSNVLQKDLTMNTALKLLKAYGIPIPRSKVITKVSDVPKALHYTGKPSVAKTAGMDIAHKAKLGGVILDIMTNTEGRNAFRKLSRLHTDVLFQSMVKGKVELIIGAKKDTQLGPFITIGLGGSFTNTLKDRSYAFLPAQKTYLKQMFKTTKAAKILESQNISPQPVVDILDRVSTLLLDFDSIVEMEINPLIVGKNHTYAADIKITLEKG